MTINTKDNVYEWKINEKPIAINCDEKRRKGTENVSWRIKKLKNDVTKSREEWNSNEQFHWIM